MARQPKYACGYNPNRKALKQVVEHWRQCKHLDCRLSLHNYEQTRMDYVRKFGTPQQQAALRKQWLELYGGVPCGSGESHGAGRMRRRIPTRGN